jgi:hypothetical protein
MNSWVFGQQIVQLCGANQPNLHFLTLLQRVDGLPLQDREVGRDNQRPHRWLVDHCSLEGRFDLLSAPNTGTGKAIWKPLQLQNFGQLPSFCDLDVNVDPTVSAAAVYRLRHQPVSGSIAHNQGFHRLVEVVLANDSPVDSRSRFHLIPHRT